MKPFFRFWYDFIVGDDWTIAAGVVVALAVTAALAHHGMPSVWWLLPLVVASGLAWSVLRASKVSPPRQDHPPRHHNPPRHVQRQDLPPLEDPLS